MLLVDIFESSSRDGKNAVFMHGDDLAKSHLVTKLQDGGHSKFLSPTFTTNSIRRSVLHGLQKQSSSEHAPDLSTYLRASSEDWTHDGRFIGCMSR